MTFDAFISYSHAADGRLAPALQRAMQQLAKPWYRVRALRVFRDESALSANPHLWASIEAALDESEWFVLLASPEAAESAWVDRELRHWLTTKSANRILLAVTDGTLGWNGARNALTGTAVPPAIVEVFDGEPRHVDLCWARTGTDLDLRNTRFRDAVAQLAAPAHGVGKDELEGEDVRLHRRARRLARGATTLLVLLTVLSVALGTVAGLQRGQARRQAAKARREAEAVRRAERQILARSLVADAAAAVGAGRTDLGLLLAVEAEHAAPTNRSKGSLLSAIVDQPMLERQLHGLDGTSTPLGFSPDGRLFAAVADRTRIWDLRTGQPQLDLPRVPGGGFADDGRLFVGASKSRVQVWDVATRREIRSLPGVGASWATSDDAPVLAAYDSAGAIGVWNLRTGQRMAATSVDSQLSGSGSIQLGTIAVSADGSTVAFAATSSGSTSIRAFRVATSHAIGAGCPLATIPGAIEYGLDLHVLADDTTVRSVVAEWYGRSALLATCNTETGQSKSRSYQARGMGSIAGVSDDGRTIATRDGSTIQLIDAAHGTPIGSPERAPYGGWMVPFAGTVVFSPDGRLFAASEFDGDVRVWRANGKTALEHAVWIPAGVAEVLTTGTSQIAITRDGRVVDLSTRRAVAQLEGFRPVGSGGTWSTTAASVGGRLVAAITADQLTVIDLERHTTRTETVKLACKEAAALAISGSLAIVSCSPDAIIQAVDISASRWQVGAPVALAPTAPNTLFPDALTFSPDGRTLAITGETGCCSGVELVDVRGARLHPRQPSALERGVSGAFTPDSRGYILAHGDGRVARFPLFPVGSASADDIARPGAGVYAVLAVSPDGRVLATADSGNTIGLWDLEARQLIAAVPMPDALTNSTSASSAAFDRTSLTTGSGRIDLGTASLEHVACRIADRNLTRSEAAQYLPGIPYYRTCASLR